MAQENKGSFVKKAAILALGGILVRFIGFLYRPFLTDLIGDDGNAYYSAGYTIYNFLLIISSAGLPAAISKMVSERIALGQMRNAHKVFQVSMVFALVSGLAGSLILYFGAGAISRSIGIEESYACIVSLAPTLLIVAVMSVYRGYFQGMNIMTPTAVSQIIEQIFNAVFSVYLAYLFLVQLDMGLEMGAAGGTIGTGIGALTGLLFLLFSYRLYKPRLERKLIVSPPSDESKSRLIKVLLMTAVPIIAGTAVFSITNIIDMKMVVNRLLIAGFTKDDATTAYGILQGKYVTLTTLPVSFATALATAAVPNIAASNVLKDMKSVSYKLNTALRVSMLIIIPASVGLGVLGDQIIHMIFPNNTAGGDLLTVGACSIVFLSVCQIATGILQGLGKVYIPVISAVAGAIMKVLLNYFLIADPRVNVFGAVISTIGCYIVASGINLWMVVRITGAKLNFAAIWVKPLLASTIMGIACYSAYYLFFMVLPRGVICTLLAIGVSVIVYCVVMIGIKGFDERDLLLLPKGQKIVNAFKAHGLL